MKTAAAAASIVLALAGPAFAQPGMTEPAPAPAPMPPPAPTGGELSESAALGLSIGGTVGSWALLIGAAHYSKDGEGAGVLGTFGAIGVMVGPSFGHWYAGKYVTRGLGLRALGIATVVAGAMFVVSQCPLFAESENGDGCDDTGGAMIALVGAGLFVAGTIDDIATAPGRVRKHNARLSGLAVAPVLTQHSAGFALGGRF
jgi:hypothetical protein